MKRVLAILLSLVMLITPMTGIQESYAVEYDFVYSFEEVKTTESENFDIALQLTKCDGTLNEVTFVNLQSIFNGFKIKGIKAGNLASDANIAPDESLDMVVVSNINVSSTGTLLVLTLQAPATKGSYTVKPQTAGDTKYTNAPNYGKELKKSSTITVGADTGAPEPDTYTVTFNSNSGSGGPGVVSGEEGSEVTIPDSTPVKEGYTFLGWSETAQASEGSYKAGDKLTLTKDYVLYAVWKTVDKAILSYNANGKELISGLPDAVTFTKGAEVTISSVTPSATGFNFLGWSDSESAKTAAYLSGEKYTFKDTVTLYAVWKLATYNITFDANGGQGAPDSQEKTYGEDLTLSTTIPTRSGYTFAGWATKADAVSADYSAGAKYTANEGSTLYAVWADKTYEISYDANGGMNTPATQTKVHGKTLTITAAAPSRNGYVFKGWAKSAAAVSVDYLPGAAFDTDAITTLYAVWELETYVVKFDANGGNKAPADITKTRGTNITIPSFDMVREGYNFLGWATSVDGKVAYKAADAYGTEGDATLYAVWELKTYSVKYDANGGTNAPSEQIKTHDEKLSLSTTVPTRTGYTFAGWATSKTAESADYAAGGEYTADADITLYAVWASKIYTVEYDANGGKEAPAKQSKVYSKDLTITASVPTREGYSFEGWATSKTATAVTYQSGSTFKTDEDTVLYAVWKLNTYTVSFDANGGQGAPANQTKTHGEKLSISAGKPTKTGYNFMGWSETADGEVNYLPGAEFTKNEDTTLYAVWELITYTVTYVTGGGDVTPVSQIKNYGTDIKITSTVPAKEGYNFHGWSTKENGTVEYKADDAYKTEGDVTLYAVWELKTYSVKYDANGGTNAPSAQTKNFGEKLSLSTGVPTKTGYNFAGWATSKTAESAEYAAGGEYTANADITLYAVWASKIYTVEYDANGGKDAPAKQSKVHGKDLTITASVPTREGYTFEGWATSKTAAATYKSGSVFKEDEDTVLYAVWKLITYTVTYVTGGGDVTPASQIKDYGTDIKITSTVPAKEGYNFLGWSTKENGTVNYKADDAYKTEGDITLYAVWELKTYSVKYDANGGTNAPSNQTKTYGVDLAITTTVPVKIGHIFLGWAAKADATTAEFTEGSKLTANADTTLYAVWTPEVYTVSFKGNGSIYKVEDMEKVYGQTLTLTTETPNRPGFFFAGWSTDKNAKSPEFLAGGKYDLEGDTTLYAVWASEVYTITLNGNGGSYSGAPLTKVKGETLVIDSDKIGVPTRDGYFCIGWAASKNATSPEYSVVIPENFTVDADCTLYAVWIKNPFADLTKNTWYQKYIGYVYYRQAMTGRKENQFAWWDNLTRGEMVTLLHKSEGKPAPTAAKSIFPDVTGGFALKPIIWASEMGIITGRNDGTFAPTESITRQDFIKILYEYAKFKGYDITVKSDSSYQVVQDWWVTSKYARTMVNWGYENGFIGNGSDLRPKENITRAQAATIIARFLRKYRP